MKQLDFGGIANQILGFGDEAYSKGWLLYLLIGLGVLIFLVVRS